MPFDDTRFAPMRDSSTLADDPDALREHFVSDGYLLLRGLLDRDTVLRLRELYFSLLPEGFLRPGTAAVDGIFSGSLPGGLPEYGVQGHPAYDFVRRAEFRALGDDPALRRVTGALLGGPTEPLTRQIVRHFHRGERRASRAHTDYDYMSQGSDRVITSWIPLGDCALATGGLLYLDDAQPLSEDSRHRLRLVNDREHDTRPLSHDLEWTSRLTERRWLWADYRAGDVAFHSPYIVHASLDTTTDAMRLSADLRFQRRGETVDPRWTVPWAADDGA